MLNAYAISKLLLDDEPPPEPGAPIELDPASYLTHFISSPTELRGTPVTLYQDWQKILGKRQRRFVNDLGRATYLVNEGEFIGVLLHSTYVIRVTPENLVAVDMGEWTTRKSLKTVNWASPGGWNLFGRKPRALKHTDWEFFWRNYSTQVGMYPDKRLFPYTNGDIIKADGTLVPQAAPDYSETL